MDIDNYDVRRITKYEKIKHKAKKAGMKIPKYIKGLSEDYKFEKSINDLYCRR